MTASRYQIRPMTCHEMMIAVDWAASEGWNPGLYDHECFFAADPDGFLIGLLDDEPIACISAVKYGETFGFLGFYIVKPAYREQGYGIQIWQAGIDRLQGRTIGLDGVVSQQANYQKFGFKLAYQNIRYKGLSGASQSIDPAIVDVMTCDWEALMDFDQSVFTVDRSAFLFSWLNQPNSHALAYREYSKIVGYGMARKCRIGFKIGPLFAQTEPQAEALLQALQTRLPESSPFFLDIPAINPCATSLVDRCAMQPVFETARMYIGLEPPVPVNKVYGVTSFELG
ncbi:GNAT family N-acetyltransferase [Methylotuvimicrobium buryatense]|uniref:GNAT family N-acetyltransferase n=2 Tax=Methylotuvimicrobium buryatense TaxID=95641 RepID=A0A4P9USY6_METBY|nr:GNAT family N-acetyltransferase [Methylotuvimicrobium buryatense]